MKALHRQLFKKQEYSWIDSDVLSSGKLENYVKLKIGITCSNVFLVPSSDGLFQS